jgi:hypothetical protein
MICQGVFKNDRTETVCGPGSITLTVIAVPGCTVALILTSNHLATNIHFADRPSSPFSKG